MLNQLAQILLYVASVLISVKYAGGYWVVGPVFGLAVIGWDSDTFCKINAARHLPFLAASTLIYALVYHVSSQRWGNGSDLAESLYGPLPIAVIIGSVLLPVAHEFFLKATDRNFARVIPLLIFSHYLVSMLSFANEHMNFGINFNYLLATIALWQGIYLYCLFPKK